MPRVVFVGHSAQPSGAELGLLRLTRALTRYEPVVILAEDGPLVEQLRASGVQCEVLELASSVAGVRHHEIKIGTAMVTAASHATAYGRELGRLVSAQRPDVVNTFTLKAHVFGRIAERGLTAPRVAHVHDRLSTDYMRPPSIVLLRAILGRCDGLVFNSASTQATVPPLRRQQVRAVVGSAVDKPPSTAPEHEAGPAFTFGCVGRITPWKGQQLALRAFAELCRRHPERDLRLRFVGGAFFGEDSYGAELELLADELGLAERIEWAGHVDDIYAELGRLDALVHCSTVPEPFGQVIVEAMAYGLPVIASDEGGPADLVTDGVNGIAFAPRSGPALTRAMDQVLSLPADRRRGMTDAARTVAEAYYADVVAAKVEAFYDDVLARAEPRRGSSQS